MSTPVSPRRRTATRLTALAALVALGVSGCVAGKSQTTPADPSSSRPTSPKPDDGAAGNGADLDAFYGQEIAWEACGAFECATVAAPLDWDDPERGSIELALQRSKARDANARIGSLLINPGGPGASGVEFLGYAVGEVLGAPVLDAYDVVGFDPRGVGGSSAVDCGDDALLERVFTDELPRSEAELQGARDVAKGFGEACLAGTGDLLAEIDTVSSARDMDLIRSVLGDEQLHYAGFSYGTFLGAVYAELYPEKVGRMLLDGALDPAISSEELVAGQAVGFEEALRAYVEDCQAGAGCPLTGGAEEGMRQVSALVERVEAKPMRTSSGYTLNGRLAFYGIAVTLYNDAYWGYLTQALSQAIVENDGEVLLQLANLYLDRTPDGRYTTNSMIAFRAINCVDYPTTVLSYDEIVALAADLAAKAPVFGEIFALEVGCEDWPVPVGGRPRGPINAPGAAPILVLGTTGDPATPYEWSVALAEQLESGVLVTWEGEGHTAYGRSNECVAGAVEDYLINGRLPAEGLVC